MENKVSSINQKEKQNYVYFIVTHGKTKKIKISISPEYEGANTLEKIEEKDMNESLSTKIYRFKILTESIKIKEGQKYYEIAVIAEEEKGKKEKYIINLKELKKDKYEYNFSIPNLNIQPLNLYQQFDIYVDILRNKYKKKQLSKENEEFILSTQSLIVGKDKKYELLFFLSIFLECFSTKFASRHLILFKPNKIEGLGKVSNEKLTQLRNILNLIYEKSDKLLHIENEKERPKLTEIYFFIVLYFNLNFLKNKIPEMFKNEKVIDYLSNKLLEFKGLLEGLILPKNIIIELIKKSKNFEQIQGYLSFAGKNIVNFLDIIYQERALISKLLGDEFKNLDKKEQPIIIIEKYVEPTKEDDINKLVDYITKINIFQNTNIKIVKFTPSIFEKYIEINNQNNLDNSILIRKAIESIRTIDKKFLINSNNIYINKIINEDGVEFFKTNIYFMQAFIKGKKIRMIYNTKLYPILEEEIEDENKIKYKIELFKLNRKDISIEEYKENRINLILENEEDGVFEAEINNIVSNANKFLYDLKFKRYTFFTEKYPTNQYNLSFETQYEIFRNLFKSEDKKEISELLITAKNNFEKNEIYKFSFFVSVLVDIVDLKEKVSFVNIFNPKKISELGEININKLLIAKNWINSKFSDIINQIIKNKNEKEKEFQFKQMAIFQLYFNLVYQKGKIMDLLNNDHYNIHIFKKLIEKDNGYSKFTLDKECIKKLLTFVNNFEEILRIISYNKDFLETLEIINENSELIFQKFNENLKLKTTDDHKIFLSKFIKFKKNDNMEKIKIQIEKLLSFEKEKGKNFVFFSGQKLFIELAKLFDESNINGLIYLNQIIILINKRNKAYNKEALEIIHKKLMKYASEGKIRNTSLLLFIKDDKILLDKEKYPEPVPLDILNGIDIEMINDEFLKIWKEIKWLDIYKNLEKEFYKKICSLFKNLKHFEKLFLLFFNDKNNLWLSEINDTFISLLNEDSLNDYQNLKNVVDLLYNMNLENLSLKILMKDYLQNLYEKKIIHEIYYKLYSCDQFSVFNDELKNLIIEFYKENKNLINPLYVGFFLINNRDLSNKEISSMINNYVIEPLEIFEIKESEKFKLLRIIIDNNLLDNLVDIDYFKSTKSIATTLFQDITNGKIKFDLIEKFFYEKKEKELFNRIEIITKLIDKDILEKNKINIKLMYKKNLIYESASGFLQLIELSEADQEDFTQINKVIIKYLKESADSSIIEFCFKLMQNYNIEFNEETNYNFLKLLNIFKDKIYIVQFLLDNTLQKFNDLINYFDKMNWEKEDIISLIECKLFFNKYINKKSKDKEIIKSFINGSVENNTFEENFKKLIKCFDIIKNIFPLLENN